MLGFGRKEEAQSFKEDPPPPSLAQPPSDVPVSSPMVTSLSNDEKQWRTVALSVQGTSHAKTGQPCQDAHHWAIVGQNTLIIAVADGAGSAPLSHIGSRTAVRAAVEQTTLEVVGLVALPYQEEEELLRDILLRTVEAAREAVDAEASAHSVAPRDMATTLIVVVATPDLAAAVQVGDGAVVVGDADGRVWPLTVPQAGEYINETTFITSPTALEAIQFGVRRAPEQRIAAFCDGLQMVALKMPQAIPSPSFFLPLFNFVSQTPDSNEAHAQLHGFLTSPRLQQKADDDLTLVVASLEQEPSPVAFPIEQEPSIG